MPWVMIAPVIVHKYNNICQEKNFNSGAFSSLKSFLLIHTDNHSKKKYFTANSNVLGLILSANWLQTIQTLYI